jgi:hypothetical protein
MAGRGGRSGTVAAGGSTSMQDDNKNRKLNRKNSKY